MDKETKEFIKELSVEIAKAVAIAVTTVIAERQVGKKGKTTKKLKRKNIK